MGVPEPPANSERAFVYLGNSAPECNQPWPGQETNQDALLHQEKVTASNFAQSEPVKQDGVSNLASTLGVPSSSNSPQKATQYGDPQYNPPQYTIGQCTTPQYGAPQYGAPRAEDVDPYAVQVPAKFRPTKYYGAFIRDGGPSLITASEDQVFARRNDTVNLLFFTGGILFILDCIIVGLSGNAAATSDTDYIIPFEKDPMGVILITVAGVLEVILLAISSILFLFCNLHLAYFVTIGVTFVIMLGTGAFGLAVTAGGMANSVCDNPACDKGLIKGLVASILATFIVAPYCLFLVIWYVFKVRRQLREHKKIVRRQQQQYSHGRTIEMSPYLEGRA